MSCSYTKMMVPQQYTHFQLQAAAEEEEERRQQAAAIEAAEIAASITTRDDDDDDDEPMTHCSDLRLRGSDGTLVIANRRLLVSRSAVCATMLSDPLIQGATEFQVGYDGFVLQAIVQYMYTDNLSTLLCQQLQTTTPTTTTADDDDEDEALLLSINDVRFLVELVDAANFFALFELRRIIEVAAITTMKKNHELAILFLAVCEPQCDATQVLQDCALNLVKEHPTLLRPTDRDDYQSSSAISQIHPLYMEEILQDENLPVDELTCFQILHTWSSTATVAATHPDADADRRHYWRENCKHVAAQLLTNHIRLEEIPTMDLSTTVKASGLVTPEQLDEAYQVQAMQQVWESSQTTTVSFDEIFADTIDCPILKTGIHKWSIEILDMTEDIRLGIASTTTTTTTTDDSSTCILLNHSSRDGNCPLERRWTFGKSRPGDRGAETFINGMAWPYRPNKLPCFEEGSIISFTLDLEGEGILTASIDGETPFELFSGLLLHDEIDDPNDGFVPFASIFRSGWGCVKFLGFEKAAA